MASESNILTDSFYFPTLNSQIMVRVSSTKASTCLVTTKTVGSVSRSVKTDKHTQTAQQNRVLEFKSGPEPHFQLVTLGPSGAGQDGK